MGYQNEAICAGQRKDLPYAQVAQNGKAVASPERLELLERLAQFEKCVETPTVELVIAIKLTVGVRVIGLNARVSMTVSAQSTSLCPSRRAVTNVPTANSCKGA